MNVIPIRPPRRKPPVLRFLAFFLIGVAAFCAWAAWVCL
jgi:hypothetical protein